MIQLPSNDFPVTLAFPPQGHWTQPHLAIPCLKAWLEARGFDDVEQMDLSVEAFDHFLTPRSLERALEGLGLKGLLDEHLPELAEGRDDEAVDVLGLRHARVRRGVLGVERVELAAVGGLVLRSRDSCGRRGRRHAQIGRPARLVI